MAIQERVPARVKTAVGPLVERLFYNDILYDDGGVPARVSPAKRPIIALNQALFERGMTPPWILTANQCADLWASQGADDGGNSPAAYSGKDLDVVGFLNDFWSPEVDRDASVLEVGCNSGPNLEGLRRLGFSDLAGIEINPAALAEMARAFPELTESATIHHGPAEEMLHSLETGSREVVFSMAVLMHIHPASRGVLADMVRVSRGHVCVIEPEDVTCGYVFARNYRRVFERLGCVEIKTAPILRESFASAYPGYVGYRARLFRVPAPTA